MQDNILAGQRLLMLLGQNLMCWQLTFSDSIMLFFTFCITQVQKDTYLMSANRELYPPYLQHHKEM